MTPRRRPPGRERSQRPRAAPSSRPTGRRPPPEREPGVGGEQVEGRHAVLELLRAGRRPVRRLLVSARAAADPELRRAAATAGVLAEVVREDELAQVARTEVPQGLVAIAAPIADVALDELVAASPGGAAPFLIVLDQVTDPHNLGAVLRSALGAGATGVVLGRHRSARLGPAACKAAAGAVEHLAFSLVSSVPAALSSLRSAGVWSVGLEADAPVDLEEVAVLGDAVALVLGSEGRGLAPLTAERCDVRARVSLVGPIESLNVSAAAAIACFAVARHRRS